MSSDKKSPSPEKGVYVYLADGFADWEPAHALAELRREANYRIETFSLTGQPVVSMGGLKVLPTKTIDQVDLCDAAIIILPGGKYWETDPIPPKLTELVARADADSIPIAAICGATLGVAKMRIIRGRKHTSNAVSYLVKMSPGYDQSASYIDKPAVSDRGLITASGLGNIEFAAEIFLLLGAMDRQRVELWQTIFRTAKVPPGLFD